ncbi:ankyrin [Hypoxylon fuscum]|nr:ankyrin [Hypoxylon fuscum]
MGLVEDEIDDLIYLARTGDNAELTGFLQELTAREDTTPAKILTWARGDNLSTCLHMAAANGHAKTVALLLSHFPPPSKTSIGEAATVASEASVETEKPYINLENAFGNTALHWACLGGHLDIVKLLLSRGASPTAENEKEQIPLDLAASNNHMHIVEFFLSQSKDIEGENAQEGGLEKAAQNVQVEGGEEEKSEAAGQS